MKDWTFQDKNIAREFDSHVREQLPWYDLATEATACLVRNYLSSGGIVYDIGASTGNIGIAISDIVKERNAKFIAIEQSVEMAQAYKGGGDLFVEDAVDFNYDPFSVAIIFLGLMFIDVEKRDLLVRKLRFLARRGGAIIIVEKFTPPSGYIGTVLRRMTMQSKLKQGASPKSILEKDLSLSGVQRPLDKYEIGEDAIEFFRMGEFAGYIIET